MSGKISGYNIFDLNSTQAVSGVLTEVGAVGSDNLLVTEQGIREAIAAVGGVTVASGVALDADYTSIGSAIAAYETIINIIGDTDETADVSVGSSGLYIRIVNSATLNMMDNTFLWSEAGNLNMNGTGRVVFEYGSDDTLFDVNSTAGKPKISNINFVNNSSASGYITNATGGRISNATIAGDLFVDGTRNIISSCDIEGNLALASTSDNNIVSMCQLDGVYWDLGSGNSLATINIY